MLNQRAESSIEHPPRYVRMIRVALELQSLKINEPLELSSFVNLDLSATYTASSINGLRMHFACEPTTCKSSYVVAIIILHGSARKTKGTKMSFEVGENASSRINR